MFRAPVISRRAAAELLRRGAVGIFPTDTLFGLVGSAQSQQAVERIYHLRRRPLTQPLIILIGRWRDLELFDVELTPGRHRELRRYWPGPVSIILTLPARGRARLTYLHRGSGTLAFRLPRSIYLRRLLAASGPLVAPSANLAGQPPAKTLAEAAAYFGQRVDFYAGQSRDKLAGRPSKLIDLTGSKPRIIRN